MHQARREEVSQNCRTNASFDIAMVRLLVSAAWGSLTSPEPLEQRAALWRLVDAAGLLTVGLGRAQAAQSIGVGRPTARGYRLMMHSRKSLRTADSQVVPQASAAQCEDSLAIDDSPAGTQAETS